MIAVYCLCNHALQLSFSDMFVWDVWPYSKLRYKAA